MNILKNLFSKKVTPIGLVFFSVFLFSPIFSKVEAIYAFRSAVDLVQDCKKVDMNDYGIIGEVRCLSYIAGAEDMRLSYMALLGVNTNCYAEKVTKGVTTYQLAKMFLKGVVA